MDQYNWKLELPNNFSETLSIIFECDLSSSLGADTKSPMDRPDLHIKLFITFRECLKTVKHLSEWFV
jgi:hypothetical protein